MKRHVPGYKYVNLAWTGPHHKLVYRRAMVMKQGSLALFISGSFLLLAIFTAACGGGGGGGGGKDNPVCIDGDTDGFFSLAGCGTTVDCDDSDPNNWNASGCSNCADGDTDEWHAGCDAYTTINGPDCNDSNKNTWNTCATCLDTDGDSWFTGCNQYITINGPDACEGDTNNWTSNGCPNCADEDTDGWYSACDSYTTINGPDSCEGDTNNWTTDGCANCADSDADGWYSGCDGYTTINGPDICEGDTNNWSASGCANCTDGDTDTWYAGCDSYITINGPDCDDGESSVYPGAIELCDGIDNQCPGDTTGYGMIDENACYPATIMIQAGCFDMGDSADGCLYVNECPVHNVCITSNFYMDVHEVTNVEYKACVTAGACTPPSSPNSATRSPYYNTVTYEDYPVIYVNWDQATAYCAWKFQRLATEAEWEYAARGGLAGKRYADGDTITCADANYERADSLDVCWNYDGLDNDTHLVGSYAPNGYGLYDMGGNVWEWVNDWYDRDYYLYCVDNTIVNDPQGPATGSNRVFRGGAWSYLTLSMRVSAKLYDTTWFNFVGFRCAGD